jgi:hypothetical protein
VREAAHRLATDEHTVGAPSSPGGP